MKLQDKDFRVYPKDQLLPVIEKSYRYVLINVQSKEQIIFV